MIPSNKSKKNVGLFKRGASEAAEGCLASIAAKLVKTATKILHRVLGRELTHPQKCPCPKHPFLGPEQLGEQRLLNSFCSDWQKYYSIFEKNFSVTK